MKVYGLRPAQVEAVVFGVSSDRYGDNLYPANVSDASTKTRHDTTFVIRAYDSSGPGARLAPSGRRTPAASWQAHYDVMLALFEAGAERIKTGIADYRSLDAFLTHAPDTYWHHVGSAFAPAHLGQLATATREVAELWAQDGPPLPWLLDEDMLVAVERALPADKGNE